MTKPLLLFVGPSGCGKTTIAEHLETTKGYKTVQSYTTRPKRYEDETGHTFVTDAEFDKLQNLVAYTEYNGNRYCATVEQLNETDIYVVDVPGVEILLKTYTEDRPICIFYLKSTVATRIDRMLERGDHDTKIISRLHNDEQYDWFERLLHIVNIDCNCNSPQTNIYVIDANKTQEDVVDQIMWYLE